MTVLALICLLLGFCYLQRLIFIVLDTYTDCFSGKVSHGEYGTHHSTFGTHVVMLIRYSPYGGRVIMLMNRNSRKETRQGVSCFDAYTQSETESTMRSNGWV